MNVVEDRYPLTHPAASGPIRIQPLSREDEADLHGFVHSVPPHDLLFLPRDIRQPKVLAAWLGEVEAGRIVSLVARRDGEVLGTTAVVRDPLSFAPHVGDVRVLLTPQARAQGLGRVLIQESFLIAVALELRKLTTHMTTDQEAAIQIFQDLGFLPEGVLQNHVRGPDGETYDLMILSHDVERFQAQREAYGVPDAF